MHGALLQACFLGPWFQGTPMDPHGRARPAAVYVPLLPNALVDFCGAPLPFAAALENAAMIGKL